MISRVSWLSSLFTRRLLGPRSFQRKANDMDKEREIGLDLFLLCCSITQCRQSWCSPSAVIEILSIVHPFNNIL